MSSASSSGGVMDKQLEDRAHFTPSLFSTPYHLQGGATNITHNNNNNNNASSQQASHEGQPQGHTSSLFANMDMGLHLPQQQAKPTRLISSTFASHRAATAAASPSSMPPPPPPGDDILSPSGLRNMPSPTSTAVDYAEIEQKQSELRHAVEYRIQSLESTLALRDDEVLELQTQLRKMEEDYKYNYNLIGERDAALEEAATQLQRLYRELKRVTAEGNTVVKKLEVSEAEVQELRRRVRDVEMERERAVQQAQKEYLIQEQHLTESIKAKEAAIEEERQKAHETFMRHMRDLEESKREVEGRTATVSSEQEARHNQVVQRLQDEVDRLQKRMKCVAAEKAEADDERMALQGRLSSLQKQHDQLAKQQREEAVRASETISSLESKLTQCNILLDKSLATAEDTVREEVQKSSRLELEKASLQSRLTDTQERLQKALAQQSADSTRYTSEQRLMQSNYEAALSSMKDLESKWHEAERQLQLAVTSKSEEQAVLSRTLSEATEATQLAKQQLDTVKAENTRLELEVMRLSAEVQRWKNEEAATAGRAREEAHLSEEKFMAMERAAQTANDESERCKRRLFDIQERSQAEAARLTRELHASEAARRALEDQFHLSQDHNGQEALINALRFDKETLERRVLELEKTNGEIREQVSNFTIELQNDPVMKSAKETQRRVQDLQQELLSARDDNQKLRDTVKEKEEELARYQVDILRAQMLLTGVDGDGERLPSMHGDALRSPKTMSGAILHQQQHMLREEWAAMRKSLEKSWRRRERKHRKRSASIDTNSSTRSSSSSSNASNNSSVHRHAKKRTDSTRRKPRSSPQVRHSPPRDDPERSQRTQRSYLLQESEVWRQKCLQLEQHLHTVLKERDGLRRELHIAKQDAAALNSERQSLLDLNSLLKAQVREAFRTACNQQSNSTGRTTNAATTAAANNNNAAAAASMSSPTPKCPPPPTEWLAAAAALVEQQRREVSDTTAHSQSRRDYNQSIANHASASQARPRTSSSRPRRTDGGLNNSNLTNSVRSSSQQQERLAALEEEIRAVRTQIASQQQQQQQQQQQEAPGRVVRKGASAVRHYAYQ